MRCLFVVSFCALLLATAATASTSYSNEDGASPFPFKFTSHHPQRPAKRQDTPPVMAPLVQLPVFDVRKYGAVGDGHTLCTDAFAKAIAAAHASAQGGQVLVTEGRYLIGGIRLLSGVYLNVEASATILASNNVNDYPYNFRDWVVVAAVNASNVGVIGAGTIDGQAVPLWVKAWNGEQDRFAPKVWDVHGCTEGISCRPFLLQMKNCSNVTVAWITLQNSPFWTSHYQGCTNVTIDSIHSLGDSRWPNNDACDPDSSENVVVRDSVFDTGDDGLCPKASLVNRPFRNLTAHGLWIRSKSCAIKLGSTTHADMHDFVFENITIVDSNRGLGIQQRDQGNVYNLTYRNISIETRYEAFPTWWGAAEPIWISTEARTLGEKVGYTHNILFENIRARSENGAMVSGRYHQAHNIVMKNVHITIDAWSNYSNPVHDYRPAWFSPAYIYAGTDGVYAENTTGLALEDCSVTFVAAHAKPYWAACFNATAVDGNMDVTNTGFKCVPPPAVAPAVVRKGA